MPNHSWNHEINYFVCLPSELLECSCNWTSVPLEQQLSKYEVSTLPVYVSHSDRYKSSLRNQDYWIERKQAQFALQVMIWQTSRTNQSSRRLREKQISDVEMYYQSLQNVDHFANVMKIILSGLARQFVNSHNFEILLGTENLLCN